MRAHLADIAYQNKAAICVILFKASAGAMLTIAADSKPPWARIGISWGSVRPNIRTAQINVAFPDPSRFAGSNPSPRAA
jgi:hypothetical protein